MDSKLKVVFIAGTGRCGSTILDMVIGQIDSAISVGELRYLWKRGIGENRLLGTGEPFRENTHWEKIIGELYDVENLFTKALEIEGLESSLRIREMLGVKTESKICSLKDRVARYADELKKLLLSISNEFDSQFIVDSSKMPMHGFALAQIPNIDLRVIHLVRDRNAVVHSWGTSKFDKGKNGMMSTQSVWKASVEWVLINRWIERYLGDGSVPYLKVSYTEFSSSPVLSIDKILKFIGEDPANNPLEKNNSFNMLPTPSISGNPSRFSTGRIVIKEDSRWLRDMSISKRILSGIYGSIANAMFFL